MVIVTQYYQMIESLLNIQSYKFYTCNIHSEGKVLKDINKEIPIFTLRNCFAVLANSGKKCWELKG